MTRWWRRRSAVGEAVARVAAPPSRVSRSTCDRNRALTSWSSFISRAHVAVGGHGEENPANERPSPTPVSTAWEPGSNPTRQSSVHETGAAAPSTTTVPAPSRSTLSITPSEGETGSSEDCHTGSVGAPGPTGATAYLYAPSGCTA